MNARLQPWLEKIVTLSVRERALLLAAALAVLYGVWDHLLFAPLERRAAAIRTEIRQVSGRIAELDRQGQQILQRRNEDPDRHNREQAQRLRAEIAQLDARLRELTVDLITPDGMAAVLEQVLAQETELSLVRLENQGARPLLGDTAAAPQGAASTPAPLAHVYRHGMVIDFRGGYLSTLNYLRALEALPWQFLWGRLDFHVENYPDGRGSITVHTLSLREGWIGV